MPGMRRKKLAEKSSYKGIMKSILSEDLTPNQAVFFACVVAGPNTADAVHYPDNFFRLKKRKLENCFREGLITEEELNFFSSFPEDRPDPEFAPAICRTEEKPVIPMVNERFGPFQKSETM